MTGSAKPRAATWRLPPLPVLVLVVSFAAGLLALLWSERDLVFSDSAPGVLVVASSDDDTSVDIRVNWRLAGSGPETGIVAELENGEWRQTATFAIIPNADPALPASHVIEIKFPDVYPGRKVVALSGLYVKARRQDPGRQLIGAVANVADGTFWVALSGVPQDRDANLRLLFEAGSFQMNLSFENGNTGVLAFDKGESGRRAFDKAYAAWRGPP